MLEIRHSDILRKIEGYVQVLGERKIALADYFKESTYQDAQDKPRKCYLITKMGCDFLANIKSIPNFDAEKFFKITGIRV